jgi:hypothetical protein
MRSKLDPFAAQLLAMNDEGKKLPEIQQWLESQGMTASVSCISNYLTKLRTLRARKPLQNEMRSLEYFPELKARLEADRQARERSPEARYQRRKLRRRLRRQQSKWLAR